MANQINFTLNPNKWIDLHADYLFNYTISRVNDHEIAKDIVQETFISGLKASKNFRGEASERTWLISILKRKIIDYYRKINSKKGKAEIRITHFQDGENKGDWLEKCVPQTWGNEAEKKIENVELGEAIHNCIDHLPQKYRMVFIMKTVKEYETDEICKELEITSSNLWVIIHRARLQLRKCLEDNWFKN